MGRKRASDFKRGSAIVSTSGGVREIRSDVNRKEEVRNIYIKKKHKQGGKKLVLDQAS